MRFQAIIQRHDSLFLQEARTGYSVQSQALAKVSMIVAASAATTQSCSARPIRKTSDSVMLDRLYSLRLPRADMDLPGDDDSNSDQPLNFGEVFTIGSSLLIPSLSGVGRAFCDAFWSLIPLSPYPDRDRPA
jgi:hypothetical protein